MSRPRTVLSGAEEYALLAVDYDNVPATLEEARAVFQQFDNLLYRLLDDLYEPFGEPPMEAEAYLDKYFKDLDELPPPEEPEAEEVTKFRNMLQTMLVQLDSNPASVTENEHLPDALHRIYLRMCHGNIPEHAVSVPDVSSK